MCRRLAAARNGLSFEETNDTLTSLIEDEDRATALTARFILDAQTEDEDSTPGDCAVVNAGSNSVALDFDATRNAANVSLADSTSPPHRRRNR